MSFKAKNIVALIALSLLSGCAVHHQVVRSDRKEYQITNKVGIDSNILKAYLPYKTALDAEMGRTIGYAEVDLTKSSDVPESVLGNFFADAVANQAKKIVRDVDFVFPTTKGGLRNDIVKGPITVSKIFELMPFENQLVLVELKGADALTVINYIAFTNGQPVNGLKLKIVNKKPENIRVNGKPFDLTKTYRILTSDYIANGGDDSQGFGNPVSRRNIGLLVRDALLNEVNSLQAAGKNVYAKLDGRITN